MTIKSMLAALLLLTLGSVELRAQQNQTIFKGAGIRKSGGYGALSNKFTRINGTFANINEIYGGWYINRSFLLGVAGAATTNRLNVPAGNRIWDGEKMTYQYGQFGLMTEYVVGSTKKVHFAVNLVTGAGFILQYDRRDYDHWDEYDGQNPNFFFVMEPGAQVELNLTNWMRFSPGVSYRRAFGSDSKGLTDSDLSGVAANITFKFGRF
ncbi:hypothetical protein [Flavihumibacter sp. CACIAM 22H1]|uniref:hypothetical protein n=1 Tax=Flavihumibacter sp. CACIAM 22H1 TaxID=1812911 RepID=UPI0007A8333C|nr:hypothetical protein [Flavihumibacter sp. CACIAM 22H1]KYP13853.1 MAG: hypothetical protein A1D16_14650 [Flavihumibacter sp. CACIAM 22H1]